MGRAARPRGPNPETAAQLEVLAEDNAALEAERVELLARPRTIAGQIAHAWISIRQLSNLRAAAMARGKTGEVCALTGAIEKVETTLRGLTKQKIDDELEAIVARIQGFDDARNVLANIKDED